MNGERQEETSIRDTEKWFVLRVKWRHEDDVAAILEADGKRVFVAHTPKTEIDRRTGKEKVNKNAVAVSEIVFAYASHRFLQDRINYLRGSKNWTVYFATDSCSGDGRRLLTVPEAQMESFIRIATHTEEDIQFFNPQELNLAQGDIVCVHGGPFDGCEGEFVRLKGKRGRRVVVNIMGVTAVATAEISPEFIEVVRRKQKKGKREEGVSAKTCG